MTRFGVFVMVACSVLAAPAWAQSEEPSEDEPGEGAEPQEVAPAAGEAALAQGPSEVEELVARVNELEDIVGELERKSAVQRLAWSADYRITLSSFRYDGDALGSSGLPEGMRPQVALRNYEQWTHRARLSVQADPMPSLRFRARLVAYKRFGDTATFPISDFSTARLPRDNVARFDRFWLDWFATEKLSFSFGRVSTTDGSPSELRENLGRPAATVSIGLVDSEYETVATTYQTGPLYLRAFYLAWQFHRAGEDPYGELPFLGALKQPLRIFGAGLKVSSEKALIPTFDLSGYITPQFRAVSPVFLPLPDGTLVPASKVPDSLGALYGATLLLLWRDLPGGLDVFASGSLSYADPSGESVEFPIGPGGAAVPVLSLVSSDTSQHLGYHAYAGFRFTSPRGGVRAPKLGAELTYGSRYLVTFSSPTTDLVTRQGVRGKTYDAYYIQPINELLFARLSYTHITQDYAPPLEGALGLAADFGGTSPKTNVTISGVNLMLHAAF